MSEPFLGQLMPVAFGYAPRGFALCAGSLLTIAQNQALFSLLGTTYGGDGRVTFALPDLRGRTPVGFSNPVPIGQQGGVENVTLTQDQLPSHVHNFNASTAAGAARNPTNSVFGGSGALDIYGPSTGTQVVLNPATLGPAGQTLPHANLQPYTVLNFCIALNGIFPSRS